MRSELNSMFSHGKRNINSNVIEIVAILGSGSVNDQSALHLHLIQNLALNISIFRCHYMILLGINGSKNAYQSTNDIAANQSLSIMHTNKT